MSMKRIEFQCELQGDDRLIYKLTISMDTVPIWCGTALKMIGSATRYEL